MVGTADSVLIREVSFIHSVLNRELPPLYNYVYMAANHLLVRYGDGLFWSDCAFVQLYSMCGLASNYKLLAQQSYN